MHKKDINKGKIVIFQEKWLIPCGLKSLFNSGLDYAFFIDFYPYEELYGGSCPLWLDVSVDESDHNDWMECQNAEILRKCLSILIVVYMFSQGS